MSRFVLLDAGPLGLVTGPRRRADANACREWLEDLLAAGVEVRVPDITDYEVRRELLRAGRLTTVVIATTNVGHLSRLVPAEEWQKITI